MSKSPVKKIHFSSRPQGEFLIVNAEPGAYWTIQASNVNVPEVRIKHGGGNMQREPGFRSGPGGRVPIRIYRIPADRVTQDADGNLIVRGAPYEFGG